MLLKIEKLDHFGNGLAHIDNKVVFVPKALPDELVDVNITKEKKHYSEGKIVSIEKKSERRIESDCPYFELCGGCQFLQMNYEDTIEYKKNKMLELFKSKLNKDIEIKTIKNQNRYNYRNKVSLKIKNGKIGYYENNSNCFIPIKKCLLLNNSINKVLDCLDLKINSGNLMIRNNYNEELLISIDTKEKVNLNIENIIKNNKVAGIIINNKVIYGESSFIDIIDNKYFKVSYNSFFQVNSYINNELFKLIKENVDGNVLDLYCGVGTLGIASNSKVIGIDNNKSNIMDALINNKMNKLNNNYILGNVEDKISFIKDKCDVVIVDPPRAGLDKKTISYLKKINPKKILYISCDAMTLLRDLSDLSDSYNISKCYILDMFSNTYHVETVCIMNHN